MRKLKLVLCGTLAFTVPCVAKSHLAGIKLSVTNLTGIDLPAAHVVVSFADLRTLTSQLNPGLVIVSATQAATVEEDTAILEAEEPPSQSDDLDGDNQADELALEIAHKLHQTQIVTFTFGDAEPIYRLRSDYPRRTGARFSTKFEGIGWESDRAYRLYFDQRNAIDVDAKCRYSVKLPLFATPEDNHHAESSEARYIFRAGNTLGLGGVGALVVGNAARVSDAASRNWRIVATGPVRSSPKSPRPSTIFRNAARAPSATDRSN
jgi:hypothetical protein